MSRRKNPLSWAKMKRRPSMWEEAQLYEHRLALSSKQVGRRCECPICTAIRKRTSS